jgi:hypothetical protein
VSQSLPRDFKGIWIPKELWLDKRLSLLEKALLAEIDSLDGPDHCYADNLYFQNMFNVKERTISETISRLKKLGLLEQVSFDGRRRQIKSNLRTVYAKFYGSASQQNVVSNQNFTGLPPQILPCQPIEEPIERERIDEIIKDKEEESTVSADASTLTSEFISLLQKVHGKEAVNPNIQSWKKEFDRLLRIDKKDKDLVRKVMNWAVQDPFWQTNIISPKKLRLKFLTLKLQMESQWKKPTRRPKQDLMKSDPSSTANLTEIDMLKLLYQE